MNLRVNTTGPFAEDFPAPKGDVADLTEDAKTLELLFRFIYSERHPTLADLPFDELLSLEQPLSHRVIFASEHTRPQVLHTTPSLHGLALLLRFELDQLRLGELARVRFGYLALPCARFALFEERRRTRLAGVVSTISRCIAAFTRFNN